MYKLLLLLAITAITKSSSPADNWPFLLADKYVEDFRAENVKLEKLAENFNHYEKQHGSNYFNLKEYEHESSAALKHASQYDFIVIGGGTSGSVLASRLSEIPEYMVLLLEAGRDVDIASKVPKNWELLKNTPYNWAYQTTPQNSSCLAFKNHQCTIPSGKALGGTSAINSMLYTRGNHRDFDLWADENNKNWCYSDVLPIMKKIENVQLEHFDKNYHKQGGLQNVELAPHRNEHLYYDLKEAGVEFCDYNGKQQDGYGLPQLTTFCGRRQSAADAYLKHAIKRHNLVIKPLSQVTKIIIKEHTKEAIGVEYRHEGELHVAKAEKEIILAAGAIQTPKILIQSGVGPKEDCDRLKIPHFVNLQVGYHLQLRPSFIGLDFILNETKKHNDDEQQYDPYFDYLKNGEGPLTSPGVEAVAYIQTELVKHEKYPDIELVFINSCPNPSKYHWSQLDKVHYESIFAPLEHKNVLKIVINLNHPKSRGTVKVGSNNPLEEPIIDSNFYSDADDLDFATMLAGVYKALEIGEKLHLKVNPHQVHGCKEYEFGTKAYWKCAIKYLTVPTEDVSGTARMGPHESDKYAVVDNHLRVHGVHKLRVADPSVVPIPITGNLIATSLLIGEKAAHLIIDDWKIELD